ncbi:MAG: DUF1573 domain-containing protein [Candidatus Adiutrix sp.]|jgi:hypothetical protein|nr:DUF1573 domain-containing protein [Candidatus Adiutrix sp.]
MKKRFLGPLAALLLFISAPAAAQQLPAAAVPPGESRQEQPRLAIEALTYFAGEVKAGSVVRHTFEIKNRGSAPLKIVDFSTGCSCTAAAFDRTVPPGQTGRLVMDVKTYREWAGREFRRAAWVTTNDPVQPRLRLIISGRVLPLEDEDWAGQDPAPQ